MIPISWILGAHGVVRGLSSALHPKTAEERVLEEMTELVAELVGIAVILFIVCVIFMAIRCL